jgi:hypothetical protein
MRITRVQAGGARRPFPAIAHKTAHWALSGRAVGSKTPSDLVGLAGFEPTTS